MSQEKSKTVPMHFFGVGGEGGGGGRGELWDLCKKRIKLSS